MTRQGRRIGLLGWAWRTLGLAGLSAGVCTCLLPSDEGAGRVVAVYEIEVIQHLRAAETYLAEVADEAPSGYSIACEAGAPSADSTVPASALVCITHLFESRLGEVPLAPPIPLRIGDRLVLHGRTEESGSRAELILRPITPGQLGPAENRMSVDTLDLLSVGELRVAVHSAGFPQAGADTISVFTYPARLTPRCGTPATSPCGPDTLFVGDTLDVPGGPFEFLRDPDTRRVLGVLPAPAVTLGGVPAEVIGRTDSTLQVAVPVGVTATVDMETIQVSILGLPLPCVPGAGLLCSGSVLLKFLPWDLLERGPGIPDTAPIGIPFDGTTPTAYPALALEGRGTAWAVGSDGVARDWYAFTLAAAAVARVEVTSVVPVHVQLADSLAWDAGLARPRVPPGGWAVGSRPACGGVELDLDFAEMLRGGTKTLTVSLASGRHDLLISSPQPLAGAVGYSLRLLPAGSPPDDDDHCDSAPPFPAQGSGTLDGSFDLDWYVVTSDDSAYQQFSATAGDHVPGLAVLHDALPSALVELMDAPGSGVALLLPGRNLVAVLGTGPVYEYEITSASASYGPARQLELAGIGPFPPVCKAWDVTVTARDALGNRSLGHRGTVVFSSTDPAATLPAPYTFTAADSGRRGFPGGVAMGTLGAAAVIAADPGAPGLVAQVVVDVQPEDLEVTVSPSAALIQLGAQATFAAQVSTTCGTPVDSPVTWTSMNPAVATVAGGTATGVGSGQVALRAQAGTGYTYAHLAVSAPRPSGSITWDTIVGATSGQYLMDVWGSGPTDVWAVGTPGLILHYDGSTWSTVRTGAAGDTLLTVWGNGPSDVWSGGTGGVLLHFTGSTWAPVASGTGRTLRSIWGGSPDDVWVVGDGGTIRHFDGAGWSDVDAGQGGILALTSVWGSRPNELWVGGDSAIIRHFDGATWTVEGRGPADADTRRWVSGTWGLRPDRIRLLARCHTLQSLAGDCVQSPVDLAFDLKLWTGSGLLSEGPPRGVWRRVFGIGDSEAWIAGQDGLIVGSGSSWTTLLARGTPASPNPLLAPCNPPEPTAWWNRGLESGWATASGQVWLVGGCFRSNDWRAFLVRGQY